jgi:putative DNA methylase
VILGGPNLPKRPIEIKFPISRINRIAEKESTGFGRRHYRPVYVMHKWWARRLGSIFRSILLYTLSDSHSDSLWNSYANEIDLSGKLVLDPMMGGGTTVVEALRFGCKVIAGDLNPVSWFIVKKEVEDIDPERLRRAALKLESEMGAELRRYYHTKCPQCGNEAEGIYYFYHKTVTCSNCAKEIPLMRDYILAKSLKNDGKIAICPQCYMVFDTKFTTKSVICPECKKRFNPESTSFTDGRKYYCSSNHCRPGSIVDWIQTNGRPVEKMYAIEFHCKTCEGSKNPNLKNGRGYKRADDSDLALLKRAKEEYAKVESQLPIPDSLIPRGIETRRAVNHGYRRFRNLFNERQLLTLGKIYSWILNLEDWDLKEFLVLAFSNSLKYNNMFAKYNATRGFITDIFRTHSYSPSMAPVEANCYDTPRGRGAFTAFVNLVIEGKEYCRQPFERIIKNESIVKVRSGLPIATEIAESYNDLDERRKVLLQCGSSESIGVPSEIADAVVTDPPYYGNVMYSELSNFFYVWLRIALQNRYAQFESEFVPWKNEIIENRVQEKGEKEFLAGLTKVFSESNRILKKDGILVFTFHHKKEQAWAAVLQAILDSGFYVTSINPVRSEMRASTHLHDMENIVYDMVIVCRKRSKTAPSKPWNEIKKRINRSTKKTVEHLIENGERPSKLDTYVMALGKCLEHYSKHYPNVMDGKRRVEVREALDSIRAAFDSEDLSSPNRF